MKRGVPPTERKARTGKFTPPGITNWARAKAAAEFASLLITQLAAGAGSRFAPALSSHSSPLGPEVASLLHSHHTARRWGRKSLRSCTLIGGQPGAAPA